MTSYFVLYHAQNVERLPHLVLRSVKLVMERQQDETEETNLSHPIQTIRVLPEALEERLEELPTVREFVRSIVGVFRGSLQISQVNEQGNMVTLLYNACEVYISHVTNADEVKKRERRRYCRKELLGKIPVLCSVEPLQAMNKLLYFTTQNRNAGRTLRQFDVNDSNNFCNSYADSNEIQRMYLCDANFSTTIPSRRMRQRSTNMEYENNSQCGSKKADDNEAIKSFSSKNINLTYNISYLDIFSESNEESLATELEKNDNLLDFLEDYCAQ